MLDKAEIGDAVAATGALDENTVAMIAVPKTEWDALCSKVDSIFQAFVALARATTAMQSNPMMKAMSRQFGVNLEELSENLPKD